MNPEFSNYFIEDFRLNSDGDGWIEIEYFARELLHSTGFPIKGEKIEVSNIFTRMPGIYKMQLLQKKAGLSESVYQLIGYFKIMLYPSTGFSIQMSLNRQNILETRLWINQAEYLYYGLPSGHLVSVTAKYPTISRKLKRNPDEDNTAFLSKQYERLPELKHLVEGYKISVELQMKHASFPDALVEFIHGFNPEKLPSEDIHEYYSRLYNLFYCIYYNVSINNPVEMEENRRILSLFEEMGEGLKHSP
jgi:hypothetical protein